MEALAAEPGRARPGRNLRERAPCCPQIRRPAPKRVDYGFTWGRPVSTWVAKLQVRTEVQVTS